MSLQRLWRVTGGIPRYSINIFCCNARWDAHFNRHSMPNINRSGFASCLSYITGTPNFLQRWDHFAKSHSYTDSFFVYFQQICTGTAIVAFTAAPYCRLTTITTNAESDENQNAALISILGESQYFKTNMMNIYAFNESHAGIEHLSLETDEIIVMRRKECGKAFQVKLTGIPATRSSSALSRGCYFPCS